MMLVPWVLSWLNARNAFNGKSLTNCLVTLPMIVSAFRDSGSSKRQKKKATTSFGDTFSIKCAVTQALGLH